MAVTVDDNGFRPLMALISMAVFISAFSVVLAAVFMFGVTPSTAMTTLGVALATATLGVTLSTAMATLGVTLATATLGVTLSTAMTTFGVTLATATFGVTLATATLGVTLAAALTFPTAALLHQNEVRITINAQKTEEGWIQLNAGSNSS
jgi:hypothetical protein